MINLLPQPEQKKLKRLYIARYAIAALMFGCALVGVALVLMTPSLFLSKSRLDEVTLGHEYLAGHESVKEHSAIVAEFQEVNNKIKDFYNSRDDFRMSYHVVAPIAEQRFSRIQIDQILLDTQRKDKETTVEIRGIANSREDLLQYVEYLRDDERFVAVDIPVQNFAENEELSFVVYAYIAPLEETEL